MLPLQLAAPPYSWIMLQQMQKIEQIESIITQVDCFFLATCGATHHGHTTPHHTIPQLYAHHFHVIQPLQLAITANDKHKKATFCKQQALWMPSVPKPCKMLPQ